MIEKKNELAGVPDFLSLYKRYVTVLTNGQRAELRRQGEPDALGLIPAYYRLKNGIGWQGNDSQLQRVCYFLPYVTNSENGITLGKSLNKSNVSESRLFQILRSEPPNDLIYLRRILQHIKPSLDWQEFGKSLYFWGDNVKRKIVEDYFSYTKNKDTAGE